jgi:hypothetical protein
MWTIGVDDRDGPAAAPDASPSSSRSETGERSRK